MWDKESLYAKAKLYVRKGLDHEEPTSSEPPLWCIMSLELLARSALAKVHPALLADPKDGANILFAFGFPGKSAPISIPAKTVFHRCVVVCPGFTQSHYDQCMTWMNWRNEEVHTGGLPFEGLRTSKWQPHFFQIASTLLAGMGHDLADFVGGSHAKHAESMLDGFSDAKKKEAHEEVRTKRAEFEALDIEERLKRVQTGKEQRQRLSRSMTKSVDCPACGGPAHVIGDILRSTTPRDNDGTLVQEDVWLPVGLKCYACGLAFKDHAQVNALGFGDQFTSVDVIDPKEYYDIRFDPSDYYEPDYGND